MNIIHPAVIVQIAGDVCFSLRSGQKFIPESVDRVRAVKAELVRIGRPEVPIEIDGGIGPGNAAQVIAAGATMLVAGSSVFKAEDPVKAIAAMRG